MKIGLDYRALTPPLTGIFSVAKTLHEGLEAAGHTVFLPKPALPFMMQNRVWPTGARRLFPIDRGLELDIYHALWPFGALPHTARAKRILTVHDIIPLHDSGVNEYSAGERRNFERFLRDGLKRADHVHFVSEFTKQDTLNQLQIADDTEKFSVVHLGANAIYSESPSVRGAQLPNELQDVEAQIVHQKMTMMNGFLFLLSSHLPHKNIQAVIDAYSEDFPPLIVVGSDTEALHTNKKNIIGAGYLSIDSLLWLFDNAIAFVFPSLHEGFGLPVVEAMLRGCPVIASSSTSIQEIAGKAAVLVDTREVTEIRSAIQSVLLSSELQDKMARAGSVHAEQFTSAAFISRMEQLYQSVVAR
jgi:glycosyltransferase involved in cell wall biosynthesis